jgi:hypothetical protein
MIGYCGIDCTKCEAFIATANDDNLLRAKIAAQWAKEYNAPITVDQINCTGCKSSGVKLNYCENMCEIRKCATGRNLEACTACADYACSKVDAILKMVEKKKAQEDDGKKKASGKPGGKQKRKS